MHFQFHGEPCCSEMNRLPDISLAKMGFISDYQRIAIRGLQPWGIMCESPHGQERRTLLQRGKES